MEGVVQSRCSEVGEVAALAFLGLVSAGEKSRRGPISAEMTDRVLRALTGQYRRERATRHSFFCTAAMDAATEQAGSPDAHDLFDYDLGLDDILQGSNTASADASKPSGDPNALGLDEEVKVTKKRQPVAKLDEGRYVTSSSRNSCSIIRLMLMLIIGKRLLSQAGIPKLRRTAKQKLRFKGKGHEV